MLHKGEIVPFGVFEEKKERPPPHSTGTCVFPGPIFVHVCVCGSLRLATCVTDRRRVTPGGLFLFLIDLDRAAAEMKGMLGTHLTL